MEAWMIQAIISIGQVIVTIGALLAILRWNGYCRVSNRELARQRAICDKRFKQMAIDNRIIKATLKRIEKHIKEIESRIYRIEGGTK